MDSKEYDKIVSQRLAMDNYSVIMIPSWYKKLINWKRSIYNHKIWKNNRKKR